MNWRITNTANEKLKQRLETVGKATVLITTEGSPCNGFVYKLSPVEELPKHSKNYYQDGYTIAMYEFIAIRRVVLDWDNIKEVFTFHDQTPECGSCLGCSMTK